MSNVKIKKTGEVGTVQEEFYNLLGDKLLIVKLSNGDLTKCYESDIEYIKDEPEDKHKDEVTISSDYFRSVVAEKALMASKGDLHLTMLFTLFGALLATEIFGEKADHD